MIPKIEIVLTSTDGKYAHYTVHCRSDTKSVTHQFPIMLDETYEVSGKKRMMDFIVEICEQNESAARREE